MTSSSGRELSTPLSLEQMDSGSENITEIHTFGVEGSPVCLVTDPIGNVISYTIHPEENSVYKFQLLQDDGTPGEVTTTSFIFTEVDEVCLLCAKAVTARVSSQNNVDLLQLLCKTLNFSTVEPLLARMNLSVSNSQFCEECSKAIVDSADILIQMKNLEESLEKIRYYLKENITNCVKSASSAINGDNQIKAGPFLRKLFGQCWSECSVDVVRLHQDIYPKTTSQLFPRKRKIKVKVKEDKLRNVILSNDEEITLQENVRRPNRAKRGVKTIRKKTQHHQKDGNENLTSGKSEGVEHTEILTCQRSTKTQNKKIKAQLNAEVITCKDEKIEKNYTSLQDPNLELSEPPPVSNKRQRKLNPLVEAVLKGSPKKEDSISQKDGCLEDSDLYEPDECFEEPDKEPQEESDSTEVLKKRRSAKRKMKPSVIADFKKRNENKPYKCNECGKGYGSQKFFDAHLKTHTGELPFSCEHCDKKFSLKTYLLNHNRTIHNVTNRLNKQGSSNYCIYCGLDFLQLNSSQEASNSVTSSEPDCLTWSEEKKRRDHLRNCPQNPRIKFKDMPINSKLPCDQCDKTFVTIHALRSHLVSIHYKIFKFYCEICAAGFLIMSDLKRHIEFVHTDEKKYHCDQCDYKFKTPRQLIYHRRRHTGQIPFTCEICGKGFITSDKLKVHSTVHSTERIFPCPDCGKLFKSKHNVYNHVYTTHDKARKSKPKKKPDVSDSNHAKTNVELDPVPEVKSYSESQPIALEIEERDLYFTC